MVTFRTEVELEEGFTQEFLLKIELMFMEASEEDIRMPTVATPNIVTAGNGEQIQIPPQFRHPFDKDEFV